MLNFVLPVLASAFWLSVTLTDGVSVCDIDSVSGFPITLETPDLSWSAVNASDIRCMVRVGAKGMVRLRVLSFSLGGQEPCSDHLEHLDLVFSPLSAYGRGTTDIQRWCGRSYGPVLETQALEWLVYYSGPPGKRGAGFNITLDVLSSYSCGSHIPITVQDGPIYIFSPGFPEQYPVRQSELDCRWNIETANNNRLLLDTVRFAVEKHVQCSYDYLSINGVKHCGFDRVRARSRSNSFDLQFTFDFKDPMEGFMLKVIQSPPSLNVACGQNIILGTSPVLLQMPLLVPGHVNNIVCSWKVDSGSDNTVVLMDMEEYLVTADCSDFSFKLYDGGTQMDSVLTSGCGPMQSFQTVRSSSRFLLIEAELLGLGRQIINVTFSLLSSPIDAAPRVLNAGTAESFIFLNMSHSQDLGILVQGGNHDPNNYSHCLHLQVKRSLQASVVTLVAGDFFMVFSGWNESFSELTTSCGREDVYRMISRGSKIFLTYKKGIFGAVWLIYSLKQDCQVDVLELQSENISRTLVSDRSYESVARSPPPFPLRLSTSYPNNAYCRWILKPASSTQFTRVRVEETNLFGDSCHDNLTVFDWQQGRPTKLLSWCDGSEPKLLSSRGNSLLLEFVSDSRYNTGNFSITYSSVTLLSECPSMVLLTAQTTVQVLRSPNYPNNYPNNVDCQWRIVSPAGFTVKLWVNVSISRDMRQCSNADFLVIYDGSDSSSRVLADLCGIVTSSYNSSTRNVLVNFHSDSSVSDRGFLLQYSTQKQANNYPCGSQLQASESQDVFITSPFYPDDYESDTDCYWVVSATAPQVIVLEVMNLDLPCVDGSVALFDGRTSEGRMLGRVCDSQNQQQYSSSQSALYLHFLARNDARHSGFRFRLRSKTVCGGEVYHLTAYTTTNYFTSPLYPGDYPPNSDCVWRIQAVYSNMTVRLDVDDIKLESTFTCNYDYVSVSDGYSTASQNLGQFCGEHKETFLSSGQYLLVHFVSDSLKQFRGFRMAYTAVSSSSYNKAGSESNSMVGAVVGGVLGGIIFLLLGITAIMCGLVRCGRLSRHPRSAPPPPQREQSNNTVFVMSPVIVNTSSLPPPYPGITNPGFTCDEAPPPPFYSLRFSAPPQYGDLEAPPPYTETMMMSHPPSPSRLNGDSGQAKDGFAAGNYKFGEVDSPALPTGLVFGQPIGFPAQEGQQPGSAAPSTATSAASTSASAPIACELSASAAPSTATTFSSTVASAPAPHELSASDSRLQLGAPDPTRDSKSATEMAATFV